MAAALVGTLAAAETAVADDTILTTAAPPALALASEAALVHVQTPAPPPDAKQPSAGARQLLGGPGTPTSRCANGCPAKKAPLLTDEILRELGEVPLLDTVMAPVTRGVTIETGDGSRSLTLAVKPTKITRGSGLVAIGKF